MAELPTTDAPQARERGSENYRETSSPLSYSDAKSRDARDSTSRQDDNESPNESYGDVTANEICAFKLDRGKIDETLANDYCAETRLSTGRESAIQNEPYGGSTVKSDGPAFRNEDESRCKSSRERKRRRKTPPDGVIIDLTDGVYGASRGGIKIGVISMRTPLPEMKFIAIPKCGPTLKRNRQR